MYMIYIYMCVYIGDCVSPFLFFTLYLSSVTLTFFSLFIFFSPLLLSLSLLLRCQVSFSFMSSLFPFSAPPLSTPTNKTVVQL